MVVCLFVGGFAAGGTKAILTLSGELKVGCEDSTPEKC